MKSLKIIALVLLSCSLLVVSCKKTKQYTITVTVNDDSMGSVTGGGVYEEKTTATLTATANTNFKFVKWDDGNTDNPRTVTVVSDAIYKAIFSFDGDEPAEDGIYVTMGSDSWQVALFQADAQSLPGKIRVWLYKSTEAEYPQFQGWMDAHTGDNVAADLLFMADENDVDANFYPNWESKDMTTSIVSIDINTHTITAIQMGKMYNRSTSEERFLRIAYQNISWQVAPEPSKSWISVR